VTYWLVCLVLLGFGYLAGFSIGPPFFYLGVGMLVLSPVRRWNFVFWPLLLAVIAFQIAYFSVAPFECSASQAIGGPTMTVCRSPLGFRYEGGTGFEASRTMSLVAGAASATLTALMTWVVMRRGRVSDGPSDG
jgi:hypothetical protein